MLKQSTAASEMWRIEVGEVVTASSRRPSGRGNVSGSSLIWGKDGGVWKAAAVWKSTLRLTR